MSSSNEEMIIGSGMFAAARALFTPSSGSDERRNRKSCLSNTEKPNPDSDIGRRLDKIYRGKYLKLLQSYELRASWETPYDAIDEYIWHGYRPNPSSIKYCLKSAFYPTNETLNFWTHFIPCVMMMFRTYRIFTTIHDPTNPIFIPFWIHCFGCCYVMLASSFAHLLNSASCMSQELCMAGDYSAVTLYGFTCIVINELYICPRKFSLDTDFYGTNYLIFSFFICYLVIILACISRHPHCSKIYLFRFLPTSLCYVYCSVPCATRFVTWTSDDGFGSGELPSLFLCHVTCFFLASFVNSLKFPEAFYPGTFDILGKSHNIFHVLLALGIYFQNLMAENVMVDLQLRHNQEDEGFEELSRISWIALYAIIIYLIVSILTVTKVSKILSKIVEKTRKRKKSQ